MADTRVLAVLWDLDGVIVDSGPYHLRSWEAVFSKRGVPFIEDDFRPVFGMRSVEIIRRFLGPAATDAEVETIYREKEETYRSLVKGNIRVLPGVLALLRGLDVVGFRQALVTSAPAENVDLVAGTLGIRKFFARIVTGRDVTEGKPNPQGYLLAAAQLGAPPADCVVMEDAVAGVQAARNAGMKCIAVTTTNPAEKLAAADIIVSSLAEIGVADIKRLLGASQDRT